MDTADRIDALLPQTQCTRCGYAACRPYAEAVAVGAADLNRCPPGGADTIAALARLLKRSVRPLDPECGAAAPPLVAQIDEATCIGCAKCLPPCPVDAILGAQKQLHTVLLALCTGCELCVAPCPVDCITMVPRAALAPPVAAPAPADNRARYAARNRRLAEQAARRAALVSERKQAAAPG